MKLSVLPTPANGPAPADDAYAALRRWIISTGQTTDLAYGTAVTPLDLRDDFSRALLDCEPPPADSDMGDIGWAVPRRSTSAATPPAPFQARTMDILIKPASATSSAPHDPPERFLVLPARSAYGKVADWLTTANRFDLLTRLDDPAWDVLAAIEKPAGLPVALGGVYASGDVGLLAGFMATTTDVSLLTTLFALADALADRAAFRRTFVKSDEPDWAIAAAIGRGFLPSTSIAIWQRDVSG